ncbi:MAG: ion transporter, partial [Nanoarchaeota archaeon]
TVLMIAAGIIFIPWHIHQMVKEGSLSRKRKVPCPQCGLLYHDHDASHCKACGHVIYQEFEGE